MQTNIYTELTLNSKFNLDNILFPKDNTQNNIEKTKQLLTKLWNKRKNILKTIDTNNTTNQLKEKEGGGRDE